jgi:hypothetical protein
VQLTDLLDHDADTVPAPDRCAVRAAQMDAGEVFGRIVLVPSV